MSDTEVSFKRQKTEEILEAYLKKNAPVKRSDLDKMFGAVKVELDAVVQRLNDPSLILENE